MGRGPRRAARPTAYVNLALIRLALIRLAQFLRPGRACLMQFLRPGRACLAQFLRRIRACLAQFLQESQWTPLLEPRPARQVKRPVFAPNRFGQAPAKY